MWRNGCRDINQFETLLSVRFVDNKIYKNLDFTNSTPTTATGTNTTTTTIMTTGSNETNQDNTVQTLSTTSPSSITNLTPNDSLPTTTSQ
jgi:hypothetical protein